MRQLSANQDATALTLRALAWTVSDSARAQRLLTLTGLEPHTLRAAVDSPAILIAVIDFLSAHEPDLIACAAALDTQPTALIAARNALEQQ